MRRKFCMFLFIMSMAAGNLACHASGIDVTIQNNSSTALRNVELDYPGGAFGAGTIAPGRSYWYHIKPTADGEITVSFERANGNIFKQKGPQVHAGDREKLVLVVDQDATGQWRMRAEQR